MDETHKSALFRKPDHTQFRARASGAGRGTCAARMAASQPDYQSCNHHGDKQQAGDRYDRRHAKNVTCVNRAVEANGSISLRPRVPPAPADE